LLYAFIGQHANVMFGGEDTKDRRVTLGAWHNPETGLIHFDVTDVFSKRSMTKDEAVAMGARRDQISVADLDSLSAGDFENGFHDSGGKGGDIIDLDTYTPEIAARRERADRRPVRPSQQSRVEEGPENVEMMLAAPIKELAAKHGQERDWHGVVAPDMERRKEIADFYDAAPDPSADEATEEIRRAYEELAREVEEQYEMLTKEFNINIEFVDYDPYENYFEMRNDFLENRRMQVMRTAVTGSHPFFSDEQNDKFRAVHDAFGHLATGRGFDRHGEEAAYQAHRTMFTPAAVRALASETRAQNQYLIDRGQFGPQKLVLLPERLIKSLRVWLTMLTKALKGKVRQAQVDADSDNAYTQTGSHHVTGGRVLKKK